MLSKIGIPVACLLGILFVAVGDRVLPHPLDEVSTKSRTAIVSSLNSAFDRGVENLPQDTRGQNKQEAVNSVTCQLWGRCDEEE